MPWIRFWSGTTKNNDPEKTPCHEEYVWYEKIPSESELKEQAEECIPAWMSGMERVKYGHEEVSVLPDDVRQKLVKDYTARKEHAERMLKVLAIKKY